MKDICNQCYWRTSMESLGWHGCEEISDDKEHCNEFMCLFKGTDGGKGLTPRFMGLFIKKLEGLRMMA